MKGSSFFLYVLLAVVIICVPLIAWSGGVSPGVINMPATGQTISYSPGDDGDLQMGVAWPNPRFTCGASTCTDNLTGLMWAASSTGPASFNAGMTTINAPLNLGGFSDWRMPNIREMESLLTNAGETNAATWLNTQGFNVYDGSDGMYWVSTSYAAYNDQGWALRLSDARIIVFNEQDPWFGFPWNQATYTKRGTCSISTATSCRVNGDCPIGACSITTTTRCNVNANCPGGETCIADGGEVCNPTGEVVNLYYLPVRTGADGANNPIYPANIPDTGRRTQFVPNDDGALQWGVDWPIACFWDNNSCFNDGRFVNNGDGTLTDSLTGLMWLQEENCMLTNYPGSDLDITYKCSSPSWKVCVDASVCDAGATCDPQPPDGNVIWQSALDFVAGINNVGGTPGVDYFPLCGANYSDWRLPNRKEMWSLLTVGLANPIPINPEMSASMYRTDQGFTNVADHRYWTSTVRPENTAQAYFIFSSVKSPSILASSRATGLLRVAPVRTTGGDDGDGVSIYIEDDAPNNGDGNDDGTQDYLQPLVTSLPSAAGYVTVVTSGGGCTQNMNVQTAAASPADPGFSYPLGVAGFEIRCATGPADMEIIFHGSSDLSGFVYRNYGSTGPGFGAPAWYEMTGTTFGTRVIDGQTVATASFQIAENQLGDHDPAGNLILSLGGPGLPAPPTAIPTMTQWGMIVFMLLAVAGAVYFIRRRRYNN